MMTEQEKQDAVDSGHPVLEVSTYAQGGKLLTVEDTVLPAPAIPAGEILGRKPITLAQKAKRLFHGFFS